MGLKWFRFFFSLALWPVVTLPSVTQPPVSWATGASAHLHSSQEDTRLWNHTLQATPSEAPLTSDLAVPDFASYFPLRRGSKLTLHFIRNTPTTYQFLRDTHPPLVKLSADVGWSRDVRRDFSDMLIIGRLVQENRTALAQMDPVRAATKYVTDLLPEYRSNPDVDYWEGWNEFDPRTPDQWNWFSQFEGQRACLMHYY